MSSVEIDKLDRLVAFLRKKRGEHASIAEVTALAEVMADSMHDFYRMLHTSAHTELKDIAEYISRTRAEIAALRPNELHGLHIPAATPAWSRSSRPARSRTLAGSASPR